MVGKKAKVAGLNGTTMAKHGASTVMPAVLLAVVLAGRAQADAPAPTPPIQPEHIVHVHIPKTAGTSVRITLGQLAERHHVHKVTSEESCFRNLYAPGAHVAHMTFLRSPRAHVFSQYLHCKYKHCSGKRCRTNETEPRRPQGFPAGASDTEGFAEWVRFFDGGSWTPEKGDIGCYNPYNMQARRLTCTNDAFVFPNLTACSATERRDPRNACTDAANHVFADAGALEAREPPFEAVADALAKHELVGLTELYFESMCIFRYRMFGVLPAGCACAEREEGAGSGGHNKSPHGGASRRAGSLAPDVARRVDALTRVDAKLYAAAAVRFVHELRAVEAETGKPLLCAPLPGAVRDALPARPAVYAGMAALGLVGLLCVSKALAVCCRRMHYSSIAGAALAADDAAMVEAGGATDDF